MRAEVVATPVLERLARGEAHGVVRGATARAAYLDFDGFVVALTAPGVPLMPNGVAVPRSAVRDGAVRARPGAIVLPGEAVTWDAAAPPAWDPALPAMPRTDAGRLRARAAVILAAIEVEDDTARTGVLGAGGAGGPAERSSALEGGRRGREGLAHLRRAVRDRDADAAARAAERLLGLGGGLTPEGDDVLAATAAVVAAAGEAAGFSDPERRRWLVALLPADVGARTTALSATLLALAREGRVIEPLHRLLDPTGDARAWRAALATLAATGASTGRAYAAAAASALALLLGDGIPRSVTS
jgi:hypothetical protein